jgi:hypothetical protein
MTVRVVDLLESVQVDERCDHPTAATLRRSQAIGESHPTQTPRAFGSLERTTDQRSQKLGEIPIRDVDRVARRAIDERQHPV